MTEIHTFIGFSNPYYATTNGTEKKGGLLYFLLFFLIIYFAITKKISRDNFIPGYLFKNISYLFMDFTEENAL